MKPGRTLTTALLLALILLPLATDAGAYDPDQGPGRSNKRTTALPPPQPDPVPFALLGSLPLPGFNADVWGHRGFAYVGTWGSPTSFPAQCPATGVRIIDLADPRTPGLVGAVATIAGTSQEDVEVARIDTPHFGGDLLVTGVQPCLRQSDAPRGLDLWDVSDPRAPQHLAFWPSGPFSAAGARGVHELHLFQRGDRAFVAAAVPDSEEIEGQGDFRLVEVTDPRRPVQVSAWGATLDGGLRPGPGQRFYDHSTWTNAAGTVVVLSYWDAGAIVLDITDPAKPTLIGRTLYPAGADGETHSSWPVGEGAILLTTDEDWVSDNGWGFLRVWDLRNPAAPVEIGRFTTPNTLSPRRDGYYSVHNPFVRGTTTYLSWFSDGVRVVDLSQPRVPREVAQFVPPPTPDPFGEYPTKAMVWGVYATSSLVLVSDINAGLYVLETFPSPTPRCFAETGACVGGRFLDYWEAEGGLAINGYPLSGETVERLEDGKVYTVQYFERARFEYHPENGVLYRVLLGQFGRRLHPADPPVAPDSQAGGVYFGETGHNLSGRFLRYWRANGGLAQFGYPISEPLVERLEDGQDYTVQYFERARFEYHPENAPPYDVLLGQFGRRILAER